MQFATRQHDAGSPQVSVLAVDDEAQILSILQRVLGECGYETNCVSSADEARDILRFRKFDVLICDVKMPGMSGLDLLREVQAKYADITVIMMSGEADLATAREAVELGASDFLVKPFSLLSVPMAIERNLRKRQLESGRMTVQQNNVLLQSIKALSAAMDAKEHATAEHCERISWTALLIADSIGLDAGDRITLELAAYMHDIGKIGVSESILMKPGKLDEAEWAQMRLHPDTGSNILSNIQDLSHLAEIIRHHHERVDGSGYPDGLSGEDIPLLARILAVADAFDAMTSDRPYRSAMSDGEAIARLREGVGTQFDETIVESFCRVYPEQMRKAA
jgi:putative two-component system response regulator